jgi:hypothetical protein
VHGQMPLQRQGSWHCHFDKGTQPSSSEAHPQNAAYKAIVEAEPIGRSREPGVWTRSCCEWKKKCIDIDHTQEGIGHDHQPEGPGNGKEWVGMEGQWT